MLVFVESVGRYSADYTQILFGKRSQPLKLALKLSRFLPEKERFSLVTESEETRAPEFEKLCGIKVGLVPQVTRLPPLDRYRDKLKSSAATSVGPKTLGTFSFTRYDKGLDVLHSAIKLIEQQSPVLDARFVLQWTGDYRLPDGSWVRKDPRRGGSHQSVPSFFPAFSNSGEYYEWIARTDVMVLPYRKYFYYDKLSRVAIDGALARPPIVYPAGTWLESFVRRHAAGVRLWRGRRILNRSLPGDS